MIATIFALLFALLLETDPGTDDTDTDTDDSDDTDDEDEEEKARKEREEARKLDAIKDPRLKIKALMSEKDRHAKNAIKFRTQLETANQRIEELEVGNQALRSARIEASFWRRVATSTTRITDLESAIDLFMARNFVDLVEVDDEGEVSGIDDAMDKLISRYPWLADGNGDGHRDSDVDLPTRRTASPPRRKQDTSVGPTQKELGDRMPELRKHRSRR